MKLYIYDRIAELLTKGYTEAKELPRLMTIWEWNPTEDSTYDKYSFVIYKADSHAFFFAGWTGGPGQNWLTYDKNSPIDFTRAVREVYQYLTEDEKTELMAETLGAKE